MPGNLAEGVRENATRISAKGSKKIRLIVDAARNVFCDKGYDTSTTDAIAQAAGVSKATMYVYFPSKEALLFAVVEDEMRSIAPEALWEPEQGSLDVPKVLRRIAKMQIALFMHPHNVAIRHLIEMQAHRFPDIGRMLWEGGPGKARAEVAAFLRAATAEGQLDIDDADLAATQFLSLVRGDLPVQRVISRESLSREQLDKQMESAIEVFLAAYRR